MLNLSKMSDQRLKAYKRSLYSRRSVYMCSCCGEIEYVEHKDAVELLTCKIKAVSIEQMSRK
jgi:hypothetical protein